MTTDDEARLVWLTNSYLYVCVFATNRLHRGGGHDYTNSADWALYFQPVQDPVYFSIGERRLYGTLHGGGHRWSHSAFTLPVECNQFGLYDQQLDRTLIDGVTALNVRGRAAHYLYAVRTFMGGTSDHHLWQREHDLPSIWGALEQILESDGLATCAAAQAELQKWAIGLGLQPTHWACLVRAVIGGAPPPEFVWNGSFRPARGGGPSAITVAQQRGIQFSALERALDELNFARNRMVHDGFVPGLDWNLVALAFLGSRFWIALFKRILEWEGVRPWIEDDQCDLVGLHALARDGQTSFDDGHAGYEQAVNRCHWDHVHRRAMEHLERLAG